MEACQLIIGANFTPQKTNTDFMVGLNLTIVPGYNVLDGQCTRSSFPGKFSVLSDVSKHDFCLTFAWWLLKVFPYYVPLTVRWYEKIKDPKQKGHILDSSSEPRNSPLHNRSPKRRKGGWIKRLAVQCFVPGQTNRRSFMCVPNAT